MAIKMLVRSRYNGARVEAGEVVDYGEETNTQLITEGSAVSVTDEAGGVIVNGASNAIQEVVTNGSAEPTREENDVDTQAAAEAVAMVKKALDNQYKKDELVDAAFKAGVEFPAEATKAVIIDAAVAQGKAQALLK